MYLKSTEHTLCIYCDFVLRSEWSLINIPGTMGVGPNNILVLKLKGLKMSKPLACYPFGWVGGAIQYIIEHDDTGIDMTGGLKHRNILCK